MIINNVVVYGEDKKFTRRNIYIKDGFFAEYSTTGSDYHTESSQQVIDGQGAYMIPGLIDQHFHGALGADFSDGNPDTLKKLAAYEASAGVTSICPATMTLDVDSLLQIMKISREFQKIEESEKTQNDRIFSRLVGIHLEGPFLNPRKKGGQKQEFMIPCNVELFQRLQNASGNLIKLVDIAPETEHAMEFIDSLKDEVVISLAHTTADYHTSYEALMRGAKQITHLFNAMPVYGHREPGVVGAAFDCEHCNVELICDSIHVHPSVVRAAFQMFGEDRIIMISDSMRAVGLSDGIYTLGGQEVFVRNNRAELSDKTLAGSVSNLMDCVRNAVKDIKIPLETVIACVTMNPAKSLGIYNMVGSITPGKYADFIILDQELNVKAVYISGKRVPNNLI